MYIPETCLIYQILGMYPRDIHIIIHLIIQYHSVINTVMRDNMILVVGLGTARCPSGVIDKLQ